MYEIPAFAGMTGLCCCVGLHNEVLENKKSRFPTTFFAIKKYEMKTIFILNNFRFYRTTRW